jgi:hypothetical protein
LGGLAAPLGPFEGDEFARRFLFQRHEEMLMELFPVGEEGFGADDFFCSIHGPVGFPLIALSKVAHTAPDFPSHDSHSRHRQRH